ncbi:MAG TPA: NAD(P)/FAD-dependent oxidoreductase, partial [Gemmatimonadaceae bacterium]|nr:NAD(P)/FAD-dependent oxidoreductase [Gemmatimonadaceae bacterium]
MVIVGAGFSGIGLAIRLRQRGITDFALLERASALGGTWRDNSYPGCACDVQSTLYSFSFAPNPGWSRVYSPQREIWDYLRDVAQRFDVTRHMAFGEEVTGATWDDAAQRWMVRTSTGTWRASFLVMASGPLSDPVLP